MFHATSIALAETLSLLSPIEPRQNNLLAADPDRAHTSSNIGVHGGVDGITAFGLGDRSRCHPHLPCTRDKEMPSPALQLQS